ncbi:MAG TPA: M48 family peptidase, partial [Bacteroidia bacterium]|nr:M48 family peptidase [Bacteroidia bacterium]
MVYICMMSPTVILTLIVGLVFASFVLDRALDLLNLRRMKPELPDKLSGYYDAEKYRRSQQYLRERSRFGLLSSSLSFVATVAVLLSGGLGMLD